LIRNGEEELRFAVQASADRRFRRRQDLHPLPVLGRRLQHDLHFHHRYRLQDQDHRAQRKEDQTTGNFKFLTESLDGQ
jgi:hypothetical protein